MTTFGPTFCNIICRCGHEADYLEFRSTPISGELPPDQYQCPACGKAWRIVRAGPPQIGWSGMVLPAPQKQEAASPRL